MKVALCVVAALLAGVCVQQAAGAPFSLSSDEFPIIMYSADSHSYHNTLAAMGVTYVHTYGMGSSTNEDYLQTNGYQLPFFDSAQANGLKVMAGLRGKNLVHEPGGLEFMQVVVQAFKDHPALGYWYFIDEPGDTTDDGEPIPPIPVADILPFYNMIHNESPVPAAIAHWESDEWRPDVYGPVQDIMMPDRYPVYSEVFPAAPIDEVVDFVREAMAPVGSKPVIPVCQVFDWDTLNGGDNDRFPNTTELRYWCYATLIQGARGLAWWSYYGAIRSVEDGGDGGLWMRNTFPPMISNFREFVDTVAPAHQPDQIRSDGRSGDDYLFLAVWERGGRKWVSLVNNRNYSRTKTVSMAGRITDADLIPLDGTREVTAQIVSGSLDAIPLEPWESYVWEAVPLGLRYAPENVQATGQSATRIDLTWTCAAAGETGFKIDRQTAGETNWVRIGTAPNNATRYSDSGLEPHSVYVYRVKAYAAWNGRYSSEVSGTTLGGIDVQPAAGSDDAEQDVATGDTGFGSADLDLGTVSGAAKLVGIRFPGVAIPDGATIESATLQFTVSAAGSDPTTLTLRGQAGDNPSPFTTDNANISSRATTTESVAWAVPVWSTVGAAGANRRSPDLSSILQVVVDRPGWTSGNALALIINGSGERTAISFDANPTNGPYLHIIYSVPQTAFEAYNDLAWFSGQRTTRITRFATGINNPGGNPNGYLVDNVTGDALPVRVSITGGSRPISDQGSHPSSGTDAHDVFDGIVSCGSTMSSGPTDAVLTFTGLRSAERYEFVLYGDRGNTGYTDRYHHVTLSGADSFENESSSGTTILTTSMPNDTTHYNAGYNTANGYVTRFDGIAPGSDGAITITVPRDTNLLYYTYANAFMFRTAAAGPPAAPTDLAVTPVSSTQIDLTWTDVATNELYYKAYRSPDGTTGWSRIDPDGGLPPDTETFSDINCTPETTYFYAVRCINAAGNSEYSSTESATTPADTPTNLTTFIAYNDLAWSTGQTSAKITTYTTSNTVGGVRSGYLKDYGSGLTIDARLTVSGGGGVQALQGEHPDSGTDAHTVFDGKVDGTSTISYSDPNPLVLAFSNLNAAATYEVVIYPDRGRADYTNRIHHATIGGANSFVNESTAAVGVTITTVNSLNDTTIFSAGYNTVNGYVTRFTAIEPGSDGMFTVTLRQNYTTADYFSYANAVMLKSPSGGGGPVLTEKIVKGATWRYVKGTAEPSTPPNAWRGVTFDDSGWTPGATPLGYNGSGGLGTTLGDMVDGYSTVYMRNTFTVPNPAVVDRMTVQVDYDDGFILSINGQEMARVNVAGGPGTFMAHTSLAASNMSASWADTWDKASLPLLRPGQNVVSLHVFNRALTSGDLHMDLALGVAEDSYLAPADDADADGMDDGWETANCAGGDGTATNDVDGDRVSDAGEFVGGTLPTDPASVFSLRQETQGDNLVVTFDVCQATAPYYDGLTRHYALEECLDLEGGAWSPVPGYADITAVSDTTVIYTNASGNPLILYRGRVWLE